MLKEDLTNKTFSIIGLKYIPNYLDRSEQKQLIETIDRQPWLTDLKRRVQHYGYKYGYKSYDIHQKTDTIPDFILPLQKKLSR